MFSALVLLCLLTGGVWSNDNCTYQRIIDHLGLTTKKDLFTLSPPVRNATKPLLVQLQINVQAILDVREMDQTFIASIEMNVAWQNEHIFWSTKDYCGIGRITVPSSLLWQPDLRIGEVVEKDKSPLSPYLVVKSDGGILCKNDQVVVTTCRMQVYKFPFDTQSCNLSVKSFVHSAAELKLKNIGNSHSMTDRTLAKMFTQYEWLFNYLNYTNETGQSFQEDQDIFVYTINMKRRSVLYVVNFIFPVLFFLSLDFACFLMPDAGEQKLSFKITILLAVTVLQLILNDILPSSSDQVPLIAVFCIGVFWLMKMSLLETIVLMYLIGLDSKSKYSKSKDHYRDKMDKGGHNNVLKSSTMFSFIHKSSSDELLPDDTTEDKEDLSVRLTEGCSDFEKLLDELRHISRLLCEYMKNIKEEQKPGYWTKKSKTINRVFFLCYTISTAVFLTIIFYHWLN